jgi:hypothetical protein
LDAVAASSSALSETTGVGVPTIPAGRFLALLFFGVRLRLILVFFAFRFSAMSLPLDFISDKIVGPRILPTGIVIFESQETLARISLSETLRLRRLESLSIFVRTPDEVQLTNSFSIRREHFPAAEDTF